MEYEEKETLLREQIVEAGKRLLETGLVARTWGNISARLSDTEFIITPSGRDYETTAPEDLVKMNIQDLSYDENSLKPSSEHGLHAACYRLRPEVNFVIHTHQFYASAVCAELKDFSYLKDDGHDGSDGSDVENVREIVVPCAHFACPGTKKLWMHVERVVNENPASNSFLMARHGALALGGSMEEAFAAAEELENACRKAFVKRAPETEELVYPGEGKKPKGGFADLYKALCGKLPVYLDDYAQMTPVDYDLDDEEALHMVTEKNAAAALYVSDAKPMLKADAFIQHRVYVTKYSKLKK